MQVLYWLTAFLLAAAAGYAVYRADRRRTLPYPWLTATLRTVVVAAALLLLLAPDFTTTTHTTEKPVILLLQDNSVSAGRALGNDSTTYRQAFTTLSQKLATNYKVAVWGFGGAAQEGNQWGYDQETTDIAAALERAQDYYGMQNLGAVVLATDGRYNQGMNPAYQQLSLPGTLYAVAIGDSSKQKDLKIGQVFANKVVAANSSFEIRADILADLCAGFAGNVTVAEKGGDAVTAPIAIRTSRFDKMVSFTVAAGKPGLRHYTVSVPDAGNETTLANNSKELFVEVIEEKKNILVLAAAPHPDIQALKDALSGTEAFKVTFATADAPPASLAAYDAIILHGLPSLRHTLAPQLLAAARPMWLIQSSQSSIPALNSLEGLTHTRFLASGPHDVLPASQPAFSAFTLPPQLQAVAEKMPPLSVPTGAIQAAPGTNVLFAQKNSGTQPLWALQQGRVPTAILAGEGLWKWRLHEYRHFGNHTAIDECIRQTVSFLTANNREKPFTLSVPKHVWSDKEPIWMNAYLLNDNNEQVNTPEATVTITDSSGKKQAYTLERSGNSYTLNLGIHAGGTYTCAATTTFNGKTYTAANTFAVESTPLELMETGADYPLLHSLAVKYNGALLPAQHLAAVYDSITHNQNIKPLIRTNTETTPLVARKWYFFALLLMATAEWLLRKYWMAQ